MAAKQRPLERWSPWIVLAAILSRADRLLQKPPKSVPFFKRLHVPMMIVEARVIRRKAPVLLGPQMVSEKEEMLAAA